MLGPTGCVMNRYSRDQNSFTMVTFSKTVLQICLLFAILRPIYAEVTGIRLLGGEQPNQGHLQVRFDRSSSFSYVCGDMWTVENSKVTCRQMGYPGLVRDYRTTSGISFAKATGTDTEPVYNVASVACQGDELDVASCPNNHSIMACSIDQTVSIICQDFGYLGCYRLRSEGGQFVPNSVQFQYDITSNDECIARCGEFYDYAGSSGSICSCTFEQPSVELDRRPDERCSEVCASNPLQACGKRAGAEPRSYYSFYSTRNGFCDEPPAPTDGNATGSYNRFGDVVNFSCTQGFDLIGMESLQCLGKSENSSELAWNGSPPICYASDLPSVEPTSSTNAVGSTLITATSAGTSTTVSLTNQTTLPGSSQTTGSDIVGFLDVKIITLLAGLITISVCLIALIIVFVCCFASRRRKRIVEEASIEMQPMQCPSPPPQVDNDPRVNVVKNVYVSGKKTDSKRDVALLDDDGQVQHNYCSVRGQPTTNVNLKRTSDHASTELLIEEESNETEYACAYDCVDVAKTGSGLKGLTSKKGAASVGAEGYMIPPGNKVQSYHDSDVGPKSPTSLRDHEYIYIENAHTPPFLAEKPGYDQNTEYETPMRGDAMTASGNTQSGPSSPLHHHYDPPLGHVFHEVKRPLDQKLSQDTGHYLNGNVIFPRSRANRDMTHN